MTWLWLFPLVWAFTSAAVTGLWIALHHIVWLRERRRARGAVVIQLLPKKGRRPAA